MAQKRTYVCNFCRGHHDEQNEVVGVKWDWGEKLLQDAPILVEHHLCHRCLRSITNFGNEILTAQEKNSSEGDSDAN